MSRAMRGPVVDLMGGDYALWREFECYTEAAARAERRRAAREQAKQRRGRHGGR